MDSPNGGPVEPGKAENTETRAQKRTRARNETDERLRTVKFRCGLESLIVSAWARDAGRLRHEKKRRDWPSRTRGERSSSVELGVREPDEQAQVEVRERPSKSPVTRGREPPARGQRQKREKFRTKELDGAGRFESGEPARAARANAREAHAPNGTTALEET